MLANVTIRVATEADGPLLADVERRSPLKLGESWLVLDRGDDYFAAARLMEDVTVLLAEVDGVPAGVLCGALHWAPIGGVERRLVYVHHARIPPEFQRSGVGRLLAAKLTEAFASREIDSQYWYISPENAPSQAFTSAAPNRWSARPVYATVGCLENRGAPYGRPATPVDAAAIVAILNACHAGEEMFLPYTVESFGARMGRAPAQYSWDRVWLAGGAVVGVWSTGESLSVRLTTASGETSVTRSAAVLDYGFLPGAEAELQSLLRAWCGRVLERGMTELTIFTCPGTRSWPVVERLASSLRPFDFWTPGIPEPEGAAEQGLYVDHIYF